MPNNEVGGIAMNANIKKSNRTMAICEAFIFTILFTFHIEIGGMAQEQTHKHTYIHTHRIAVRDNKCPPNEFMLIAQT